MATKGVVCSYEEIIDLHTESDHVTCLGIHTPTGDTPRRMFKGFFDQYKKYKYLGCSMKLVPAARLPADPMHVSTEAGDLIISPRDLMNPILFHGCHGDDLGVILNTLYGAQDVMDSVSAIDVMVGDAGDDIKTGFYEILERLYYRALTDKTWKKASVSRGFRKDNLHPLVYSLATNRQIMPGSKGDAVNFEINDFMAVRERDPTMDLDAQGVGVFNFDMKNNLQMFTPRLTSLGWMDTRNVLTALPTDFGINVNTLVEDLQGPMAEQINYAELPKLFMGCVLLPPAYLTEQYFRLIINHRFAFKNFRGISFTPTVQAVPSYADANDDLFDPEKFEGSDFDDGSSSGGDDPDPEPEPEPEPTPAGYVFFEAGNNSGVETRLVISSVENSANISYRTPFYYLNPDDTTEWIGPVTVMNIGGTKGPVTSDIMYFYADSGTSYYPYFITDNASTIVSSGVVCSPVRPWDGSTSPDVNNIVAEITRS